MRPFEHSYADLVARAISMPERLCRNGITRSFFGGFLEIPDTQMNIPLIQGRQMFFSGIIGEFAAFVRGPKHVDDFVKQGCNYWEKWAKPDGSIALDYGNAWLEEQQIRIVADLLKTDPFNRRMLISGWRPERLKELDLPCCHYAYQFYVRQEDYTGKKFLDIYWHQRSTDLMIGLPSDIVLAYLWLVAFCTEVSNMVPGRIYMSLGDCHIYEEHYAQAYEYLQRVKIGHPSSIPCFAYSAQSGTKVEEFDPGLCDIAGYTHLGKLPLEVKA